MAMQPVSSVTLIEQKLPQRFIAAVRVAVRKSRPLAVLAVGLALVPPQAAFSQINSQQEQQQRDQQQREEQQREQQQRDQQQRDQQQREQQQRDQQQREAQQREQEQREQQQREQQQRDQQQREQQQREEQQRQQEQRDQQQREQAQRDQQRREQEQRDQQQREQQQHREQQQREQQQREQQARDQQQREEQQREQQQRAEQERQQQQRDQELKAQQQREQHARDQQQRSSDFPVPSSKSGSEVSNAAAKTPAADVKRATPDIRSAGTERNPDTSLPVKPVPHPFEPKPVPEVAKKTCKDGPCQPCSSTQAKDKKDGACDAAVAAKAATTAAPKAGGEQTCAAGQVWNGTQCLSAGAQPCTPGQIGSASCQAQCITATAAAQAYIDLLRMARQQKDDACLKNQTSKECTEAELDYTMRISEYRNYLGLVPIGCQSTLLDPSAI